MAVYNEQKVITISQSEYQLLLLLMENKGKTVAKATAIRTDLGQKWKLCE